MSDIEGKGGLSANDPDTRAVTYLKTISCRNASLPREAPRLCRGGSNSLTFKAVVHR